MQALETQQAPSICTTEGTFDPSNFPSWVNRSLPGVSILYWDFVSVFQKISTAVIFVIVLVFIIIVHRGLAWDICGSQCIN